MGLVFTEKDRASHLSDYIEAALWSSIDSGSPDDDPLDDHYGMSDIDAATLCALDVELREFVDQYYPLVDSGDKDTDLGHFVHNFWLTRNGHGAGFWDGDYKNGDELTEACMEYGERTLYVGDHDTIYAMEIR